MKNQDHVILVALDDSTSSRAVVGFLKTLPLSREACIFHLIHFLRKPAASEDLMGKKFSAEQPGRMMSVLEKARDSLVSSGFKPDNIQVKLITEAYATVADGIIDQYQKHHFDMVVIGRKRMSKAEEFVMGDPSIKLIRALEGASILVIKSK